MRVLVFLLFVSKVFSDDCTLDVSDSESPFIVTDDLKFPKYAVNQTFNFTQDTTFYVVCPGNSQSPLLGENGDHVNCENGTQLYNIRTEESIDFVEIKCKPSGAATVKTENETCANDKGTLYYIGFDVDTEFLTAITICYDTTALTPIYCKYNNTAANDTQDELFKQGSESYYNLYICVNGTECEWTDTQKLFTSLNIDGLYNNQTAILQNLGVGNDSSLLRLPLAATNAWYINKDNNGQAVQKVPYYDYINVVPVWDISQVDVLLYVLDTNLGLLGDITSPVIIGTLGVATMLPSGGEDAVEIYLAEEKIPVPKWIWINLDLQEQIVFYFNNPDTSQLDNETDAMCSDHIHTTPGVFTCTYDTIIDTEMTEILTDLGLVGPEE